MSEELNWGHSTVETSCPLDCPDACSLAVTVERGRSRKIDGEPPQPHHRAASSAARSAASPSTCTASDRLQCPADPHGPKGEGQFRQRVRGTRRSSVIASRIDEVRRDSGGEAILPFCYGGSNGLLTQDAVDARLFRRLGASRLARTVCAAPTGARRARRSTARCPASPTRTTRTRG